MYVNTDKLWILGSATLEKSYKASFDRGNSTLASRRSVAWSPEHEAFMTGFQGDMLTSMSWEPHLCPESGAGAILQTCRAEYERFFASTQNTGTQQDIFWEDEFCFGLVVDPVPPGADIATRKHYPGFQFSFYGPSWKLETVSMRGTLVLNFA